MANDTKEEFRHVIVKRLGTKKQGLTCLDAYQHTGSLDGGRDSPAVREVAALWGLLRGGERAAGFGDCSKEDRHATGRGEKGCATVFGGGWLPLLGGFMKRRGMRPGLSRPRGLGAWKGRTNRGLLRERKQRMAAGGVKF